MDDSNTTEKQRGGITGKGFVKGDARINRKGRPKSFDTFRREAIKIAGELLKDQSGTPAISRANAILMEWSSSRDVRKQQLFVEYAFGKVPNKDEHSGTVRVETWQDEVIALLKAGTINADDVKRELGDELAQPVLLAAWFTAV